MKRLIWSWASGFRNLANYEAGLREILRVLKPGRNAGDPGIHGAGAGVIGDLYRFYCRAIVEKAMAIAGKTCIYTNESVAYEELG